MKRPFLISVICVIGLAGILVVPMDLFTTPNTIYPNPIPAWYILISLLLTAAIFYGYIKIWQMKRIGIEVLTAAVIVGAIIEYIANINANPAKSFTVSLIESIVVLVMFVIMWLYYKKMAPPSLFIKNSIKTSVSDPNQNKLIFKFLLLAVIVLVATYFLGQNIGTLNIHPSATTEYVGYVQIEPISLDEIASKLKAQGCVDGREANKLSQTIEDLKCTYRSTVWGPNDDVPALSIEPYGEAFGLDESFIVSEDNVLWATERMWGSPNKEKYKDKVKDNLKAVDNVVQIKEDTWKFKNIDYPFFVSAQPAEVLSISRDGKIVTLDFMSVNPYWKENSTEPRFINSDPGPLELRIDGSTTAIGCKENELGSLFAVPSVLVRAILKNEKNNHIAFFSANDGTIREFYEHFCDEK